MTAFSPYPKSNGQGNLSNYHGKVRENERLTSVDTLSMHKEKKNNKYRGK